MNTPEPGQLVSLRNRFYTVTDIYPHDRGSGKGITNRVELECVNDDRIGETLSVIWEREVNTKVIDHLTLPEMVDWDDPATFNSFVRSIRWSASSVLSKDILHCPFMGSIELEPYQLEPVVRAVTAPRVNLLIADDVGLGKTIEAGLVLQEMISRSRVRDCLIVCPASLQKQWQEEMLDRFNLEFRIIDRPAILQLRREYGTHINPWRSYPRLITSMDFIKRESNLADFESGLRTETGEMKSWDLLILDEAHNCSPSGRKRYIRDSKRTKMLRAVSPHFRYRLFLTATPHNGYTESFTALLEMLDPLRFHRDRNVDQQEVNKVMVRRLKEHVMDVTRTRNFAKRRIDTLEVPRDPETDRISDLLETYIEKRAEAGRDPNVRVPVRFALNMLRKRFLSSPLAFANSIRNHIEHITRPDGERRGEPDEKLMRSVVSRASEDQEDDLEKKRLEEEAVSECSRFFATLSDEEFDILTELWEFGESNRMRIDAKLDALRGWIETHLKADGDWNGERLILFTEYKDSLDYLQEHLTQWCGEKRLLSLYGGMSQSDREPIKQAFQSGPEETSVRILVATDAAAEGLNLQNHCRYMIHYEIPWNPNKLEQRNGRIDRHGQRADEVFIYHFLHQDRRDSEFLKTVVEKVNRQRHDLGSIASVIEESVERRMLGEKDLNLDAIEPRRTLMQDVAFEIYNESRHRELQRNAERSREKLGAHPKALREILDSALKLEGHPGLEPARGELAGKGALLKRVPRHWGARCAHSVKDSRGALLSLVFSPEDATGREDVELVHLSHPLMHRAISVFRRNMFEQVIEQRPVLNRATYTVVPSSALSEPILAVYVRTVAVGEYGRKLHEEVEPLYWRFDFENLARASEDALAFVPEDRDFPRITPDQSDKLRRILKLNEENVEEAVSEHAKLKRPIIERKLRDKAAEEESRVRGLINTRMKEIRATIKRLQEKDPDQLQLELETDEFDQYMMDFRRLQHRLDTLEEERKAEPLKIKKAYTLRSLRVFPLGLEIILPADYLEDR